MTRAEALSALGLEEGATAEDVRLAHRELTQMLHPDKYEGNKRLRARAEQQMRSINEARSVLLGSRRNASAAPSSPESPAARTAAAKAARAAVMRQLVQTRERLVVPWSSRSDSRQRCGARRTWCVSAASAACCAVV